MTDTLDIMLRLVALIAWGAMFAFMAPGAFSVMRRTHMRRGDPMRLACATTAIVFMGYQLRFLILPDNESLRYLLHVASAANAVFVVRLGVAYGRGPIV